MTRSLESLTGVMPFAPGPDFFQVAGYRRMAMRVLLLTLDELMCDPAKCRSGPERLAAAEAKANAIPWFQGPVFDMFASALGYPESIEVLRRRCIESPRAVRADLSKLIASTECVGQHRKQVGKKPAEVPPPELRTNRISPNAWPFQGAPELA